MRVGSLVLLVATLFHPALRAEGRLPLAVDPSTKTFAAVSVADLGASATWYQETFGLTRVLSYRSDDGGVEIVVLSGPGLTVELQQHRAARPAPVSKDERFLQHGIFKFGVFVADVDGAVETLRANDTSIVIEPFRDEHLGARSALVEDNSGNLLQLFEAAQPGASSAPSSRSEDAAPSAPTAPAADDLAAVRALEERVALVLAEEGFEAYAELFDPDYRNWADDRPLRDRDEFLARVRPWYEAGNRAVRTEMTPVSIELFGDLALSLYVLTEEFRDGSRFTGRFVSLARKRDGRWRLYRTTFTTVEAAPAPAVPERPQP